MYFRVIVLYIQTEKTNTSNIENGRFLAVFYKSFLYYYRKN